MSAGQPDRRMDARARFFTERWRFCEIRAEFEQIVAVRLIVSECVGPTNSDGARAGGREGGRVGGWEGGRVGGWEGRKGGRKGGEEERRNI